MARDLKPGDIQEADIVDLAHDGRGVARVTNVFDERAIPVKEDRTAPAFPRHGE